jgi:hypothetical protein
MTMTNIRMKIAAAATILGLGGLGGFAMASNPAGGAQGVAPTQIAATQAGSAAAASKPVVTRTSGAAAPTAPVTTPATSATKALVTRTSAATAGTNRRPEVERDDGPALYED